MQHYMPEHIDLKDVLPALFWPAIVPQQQGHVRASMQTQRIPCILHDGVYVGPKGTIFGNPLRPACVYRSATPLNPSPQYDTVDSRKVEYGHRTICGVLLFEALGLEDGHIRTLWLPLLT